MSVTLVLPDRSLSWSVVTCAVDALIAKLDLATWHATRAISGSRRRPSRR
jgi:hypothetical protein